MVTAKLRRIIVRILSDSGVETADFETEQLFRHFIGDGHFMLDPAEEIEEKTEAAIHDAAVRRAKGEPLQYIIGEWDFYGYTFKVGKGVLIPRPETEVLVEKVLPYLNKYSFLIDLCSGSGCIPISIAKKTSAHCVGVEISEDAARYFRENNALHGTEDRVKLMIGDIFMLGDIGNIGEILPPADVITANPPYLTADEMASLQREVRHEPETALFGGDDGLDFYRGIFKLWKPMLKPNGIFAVETGDSQSGQVAELMREQGFYPRIYKDYSGFDRVVIGNR